MVRDTLVNEWRAAGVQAGDILLLHSNIRRTLTRYMRQKTRLRPVDLLESFLETVGPTGTLLLPLFNFEFTKGQPFDIRGTPSRMGALTEAGRQYPSAVRTGHPIYSFAAIGHDAHRFRGIDNFSGYGHDSPFALLRELGGRIASLDLPDQESMTFYHHVEEMREVDYRYHKRFTGEYTDISGNAAMRTYSLFVRRLDKGVETHVNPTGELMWEAGLFRGCRPRQGCGLRIVAAEDMFRFVSDIITSGSALNLLYKISDDHARAAS